MSDTFSQQSPGLESPAFNAAAVTPSDSDDLARVARALYIGVAGNVSVITKSGNSVIFVGLNAGSILPVSVSRVNLTSTTATNIVALW